MNDKTLDLSAWTGLTQLHLDGEPIDLSSLRQMKALYQLTLLNIPVVDHEPFTSLSALTLLRLENTESVELAPLLSGPKSLENISVLDSPLGARSLESVIPELLEKGVCVEWSGANDEVSQEPAECFSQK